MNDFLEIFRGGVVVEVMNVNEARMAEEVGAVAVLLNGGASPAHVHVEGEILEKIKEEINLPILVSFRPGHFVEAEVLANLGIWGFYADSRLGTTIGVDYDFGNLVQDRFPMLMDIEIVKNKLIVDDRFNPVLRGNDLEDIIEKLQHKKEDDFLFVAGPIQTISDVALLRRMGADTIILPHEIFNFSDALDALKSFVEVSFHFDNSEKIAKLLDGSEEEEVKVSWWKKLVGKIMHALGEI